MSRSKRKPYASVTGITSNKQDKRLANRRFRRYNKSALLSGKEVLYKLKECSDVWGFNSDGLDSYVPGQEWIYRPSEKNNYIEKIKRK